VLTTIRESVLGWAGHCCCQVLKSYNPRLRFLELRPFHAGLDGLINGPRDDAASQRQVMLLETSCRTRWCECTDRFTVTQEEAPSEMCNKVIHMRRSTAPLPLLAISIGNRSRSDHNGLGALEAWRLLGVITTLAPRHYKPQLTRRTH